MGCRKATSRSGLTREPYTARRIGVAVSLGRWSTLCPSHDGWGYMGNKHNWDWGGGCMPSGTDASRAYQRPRDRRTGGNEHVRAIRVYIYRSRSVVSASHSSTRAKLLRSRHPHGQSLHDRPAQGRQGSTAIDKQVVRSHATTDTRNAHSVRS
eukprot:scaffold1068_cov375-Prasinococcus_capsulatus_cf.AAC.5